jgi:hypothetical protein
MIRAAASPETRRASRGPHGRRPEPPRPPIVPEYVYPWRRLADWGFGSRNVAALVKAGLPVLRWGKMRFFTGRDLIAMLQPASGPAAHGEDVLQETAGDSQDGNGRA